MACGSTLMQRKVYDPLTFRLGRVRTERFTLSGNTFSFVTGTVRQDSTYTYDRAGNITQMRETSPNSGIASNPNELIRQYQYDALYRLLSAKGREWDNKNQNSPWGMPATANLVTVTANARLWERLYDYDLMGNLLRMRHVSSNSPNSFTRLYNPDANNNMVTQFGANNRTTRLRTGTTNIDYLYDASGNMTRESSNRNLEYDQRQLTRLYMISTSGYEHYQYGAGGELVKRFSRSGSEFYSNVEIDGLFQYNNRLNIATDHQNKINVLDSSGNTVAQRRMGSAMGEASYTSDELYMLHNHTGSIIGTYDLNGAQQEGEDFYPFGETAHNWNGNKVHRFGGKLRSFSSGFYLFGARQYAPWLAKFTSVDPLAAQSTDRNPYHYASNNPINRTDPTGMSDGKGDGKGQKSQNSGGESNYYRFDKKTNKMIHLGVVKNGDGENYIQRGDSPNKIDSVSDENVSNLTKDFVLFPNQKIREGIASHVDDFIKTNSKTKSIEGVQVYGTFKEGGGFGGKYTSSNEYALFKAKTGTEPKINDLKNPIVLEIDPLNSENPSIDSFEMSKSGMFDIQVIYHFHPSAKEKMNSFGETPLSGKYLEENLWRQELSKQDTDNALGYKSIYKAETLLKVSLESKEVEFYDTQGGYLTIPLSVFQSPLPR